MDSTQHPKWLEHCNKAERAEVLSLLKQVAKGDGLARIARDRIDRLRNRAIKRASREAGQ